MKFSSLLLCLSVLASGSGTVFAECKSVNLSSEDVPPNYVIISRNEKALYFSTSDGAVVRCPVAIPADSPAKKWMGWNQVKRKVEWPAWQAPDLVVRSHPEFSGKTIPGHDPGNPMGAAALELLEHESAIHGTTVKMRASIGTAASFGCIRMFNEDVQVVYRYVQEGDNVCMGTSRQDALSRCYADPRSQTQRFKARSQSSF